MSKEVYTLSFYGTDGCGKSSIARHIAKGDEASYVLIGGSSYKEWLSDDVARMTLGPNHYLNKYSSEHTDQICLFEDIAIACYGLARHMNEEGRSVIIDSDPYTKRVIWSELNDGTDDAAGYLSRFESKMTDYIGRDTAPDLIAAINMQDSCSEEELISRIVQRGGDSSHDPNNLEEMQRLNGRVRHIWREIEAAQTGGSAISGFNTRLGKVALIYESNENCSPDCIDAQTKAIANRLTKVVSRICE